MADAAIRFEIVSPDDGDGLVFFGVDATNGRYSAAQEFYDYPDDLASFGKELTAFPTKPHNAALFEIGSKDGNSAYYMRIRAYLFDAVGHASVEVVMDNRRENQHGARSEFQIHCEVAAINRLGNELLDWLSAPEKPMLWKVTGNKI